TFFNISMTESGSGNNCTNGTYYNPGAYTGGVGCSYPRMTSLASISPQFYTDENATMELVCPDQEGLSSGRFTLTDPIGMIMNFIESALNLTTIRGTKIPSHNVGTYNLTSNYCLDTDGNYVFQTINSSFSVQLRAGGGGISPPLELEPEPEVPLRCGVDFLCARDEICLLDGTCSKVILNQTINQTVNVTLETGGAGGGGVIKIIYGDVSLDIDPQTAKKSVTLSGSVRSEFKITNNGPNDVNMTIRVNRAETNKNIVNWISFEGFQEVQNIVVPSGKLVISNVKYVRYDIKPNSEVPVGTYRGVLDIMVGGNVVKHYVDVEVKETSKLTDFLNTELLTFSEPVCISKPFVDESVTGMVAAEACLTQGPKSFTIKNALIIFLSLAAIISLGVARRLYQRKE
ncbi:MAG TPA: hypothetical protein VJ044_18730, partial [Candidatus Hodarchaeales archaeon]|nr:hypothetical protein [Candidatus Hodarchaeales archaeon]